MVIAFRNWFRKHCKSQVGWAAPTVDQLPATTTKDKLMERYNKIKPPFFTAT
jgi:hypothetical protein